MKQVPAADGEVKIEEIYPNNKDLANKHGGIVLVGNHLFGDSDDQGVLLCADLISGEVKWKKRGSGSGSIAVAAADGCIYMHIVAFRSAKGKAFAERKPTTRHYPQ